MNKKLLLPLLFISLLFLGGCAQNTENNNINTPNGENLMSKAPLNIDRIEVLHFHTTQQCWACITVGQYAQKTIKEKFPEEYESGKIIFKDINGELMVNRDLVTKYQARGSSLFINTIVNGQDNIDEDINVWRFIYNENQFINYFEKKINNILGK